MLPLQNNANLRTVIWRRIDLVGMDACRIDRNDDGYAISGTAIYLANNCPVKMEYQVICDAEWCSHSARLRGWVGTEVKSLDLLRSSDGSWAVNGKHIEGVDGLVDIDLGFTPSTNTNAINRLGLEIGVSVETTAVWLDVDDWTFKPLVQSYQRLSKTLLGYASPSHDYQAELQVDEFGIIQSYPQLWEAIPDGNGCLALTRP